MVAALEKGVEFKKRLLTYSSSEGDRCFTSPAQGPRFLWVALERFLRDARLRKMLEVEQTLFVEVLETERVLFED